MARLSFFKVLILLFVVSIGIISTYMLMSLDPIKIDNNQNITPNNNNNKNKIDNNDNNNAPTKSSDLFTPNKKVIVIEKEIIKEVVKEVCGNIELNNRIKNNEDGQTKIQETKINNNEINNSDNNNNNNNNNGFKDNLSMVNYFLTYQYYYTIEEYKNTQYLDKSKYDVSLYTFPEVQRISSNFTPTIEETDKNIEALRETYQLKYGNNVVTMSPTNINSLIGQVTVAPYNLDKVKDYQLLLLKKVRARVWDEFYFEYGKYKSFMQFSLDQGISFQPPRLSLPLDTSKPLLTPPYLFMHVPKAGGHTMYNHMIKHFKTGVLQQWSYPTMPEMIKVHAASNVILGHYEYGIHKELLPEAQKTYNYMTMLRDPVERVISHYFFHKSSLHDGEHKVAVDNTLEKWLEVSPRGNNEMTRVMSGITKDEEFMPNNETFNMALFHLRSMRFVGITEQFTESIALMKFYIGLENPVVIEKQNVGKLKPTNVTEEIIEKIKERNWMDILLYEEALKMFHRQIDIVGKDKYEAQLLKIKSNIEIKSTAPPVTPRPVITPPPPTITITPTIPSFIFK